MFQLRIMLPKTKYLQREAVDSFSGLEGNFQAKDVPFNNLELSLSPRVSFEKRRARQEADKGQDLTKGISFL